MLIFDVNHSSSAAQKGWALLDLIERQGVSVIPVKDTRPLVNSWREFQTRTPVRQEVVGWLRQWPDADFALLTGKRFVVVDLDTEEAKSFAEGHLPPTPMKQKTPRGEHWFYSVDSKVKANSAGCGLDIRAAGGYLVVQPSKGYQLNWEKHQGPPDFDRLPVLSAEDVLAIEGYRAGPRPSRSSSAVVEGERNATLTRYVGGMLSDGLSGSALLAKALDANSEFDPPMDRSEVAGVVRSIEGRERRKDATALPLGHTFEQLSRAELPEASWLVKDFLPEGTSILVGPPKSGKSALLEYLATEIDGEVLYFAFEYNKPMLQKRIKNLAASGVTGENIRFFQRETPLDAGLDPLTFVRKIASQSKPAAIFVDTLATVKRENQGTYDSEYKACAELIEIAGANRAGLVVAHHSKKRVKDFDETLIERVLGSTAIAASFDNVLGYSRDGNATRLMGQGRLIEDFSVDLLFDAGRFTVDEAGLVQAKVHQKRMPSAYRILEFLSEGPRTSSELHEKMNNELSDTISVSNLGNQLKQLVEKELVIKENRRGGRYSLVNKKRYS